MPVYDRPDDLTPRIRKQDDQDLCARCGTGRRATVTIYGQAVTVCTVCYAPWVSIKETNTVPIPEVLIREEISKRQKAELEHQQEQDHQLGKQFDFNE